MHQCHRGLCILLHSRTSARHCRRICSIICRMVWVRGWVQAWVQACNESLIWNGESVSWAQDDAARMRQRSTGNLGMHNELRRFTTETKTMKTITAYVYTCSVHAWCLVTCGICCCHDVGFAKVVDPSTQHYSDYGE